ncbi:helix-turn-helix domain-containing protein [Streptomyces rochei]|uniref:helix-turn-helix domain-containing protein n=1 Tax=Streptomyces rochei TaxID=1928 RepID=UPI0033FE998A
MTHRSGPEHGLLVLARELAVLRARTGLSLDALARRTTASRSSWHRYLNGTLLPPRALVQELCALADEPPGRLLALWDLAAEPGGPPPTPPPPPSDPGPRPSRPVRERARPRLRRPVLTTVFAGGLTLVAVLAAVSLPRDSASDSRPEPLRPGCTGAECAGRSSQPQACAIAGSGTRTVAERRPERGPSMDIRYSPFCEASWARIWFGRVGDRVEISAPGQGTRWTEIKDRFDAEGYLSTPMVGGGPEGLRACLILGDTAERHCLTS